jgi:hypothetical protein
MRTVSQRRRRVFRRGTCVQAEFPPSYPSMSAFRPLRSTVITRFSAVGSEEARLRAGLRPPLKLHGRFSRMQLSRRHLERRREPRATTEWTLRHAPQVSPGCQYPRTVMYGFFAKRTDPPHRPYSSDCPSRPSCLRPPPSPTHSGRRSLGHAVFAARQVLHSGPSTGRASLATSLALIGLLTPVPPGDPASPPEVTRCSSVPCHPQTPWCGG